VTHPLKIVDRAHVVSTTAVLLVTLSVTKICFEMMQLNLGVSCVNLIICSRKSVSVHPWYWRCYCK